MNSDPDLDPDFDDQKLKKLTVEPDPDPELDHRPNEIRSETLKNAQPKIRNGHLSRPKPATSQVLRI